MTILKKFLEPPLVLKGIDNTTIWWLGLMLDIVGFDFTFYVAMVGCFWISYGGDSRENVNLRKDGKTKFFFLW